MSFQTSIKNYVLAESLFDDIRDNFEKIDQNISKESEFDIKKLLESIKKLTTILNRINVNELQTKDIKEKDLKNIEFNINFIYESIDYMYRYLQGRKYANDLNTPVNGYFERLNLPVSEYKKWASDERELTKKYIEMLTHPNNSLTYKNVIKRMILGTMSLKEFEKIFHASKEKMIPTKEYSFKSFKNYKDENIPEPRKIHPKFKF